jgi:hypothetical protein
MAAAKSQHEHKQVKSRPRCPPINGLSGVGEGQSRVDSAQWLLQRANMSTNKSKATSTTTLGEIDANEGQSRVDIAQWLLQRANMSTNKSKAVLDGLSGVGEGQSRVDSAQWLLQRANVSTNKSSATSTASLVEIDAGGGRSRLDAVHAMHGCHLLQLHFNNTEPT